MPWVRALPGILLFALAWSPMHAQTLLQSDLPTDFIPEGLAWDAARGRWLIGSVHLRRIDAVDARSGVSQPYARDLDSVLGLHVSPDGRRLWAATSRLPEADVAVRGAGTGLWEFDLLTGRRLARHRLPMHDAKSSLGDFLFVDARTIVASDSGAGGLWRFDLPTRRFTSLLPAGSFESPQGLASGREPGHFYLADYATGLWVIGMDGARQALVAPGGVELRGIDGLYRTGDQLVAIQNGTRTHRIVLICLSAESERIEASRTVIDAQPGWDEPTLGEIVGAQFSFVANSQWNKFDEQHRLAASAELTAPRIARLDLPASGCAPPP